MKKTYLRNGSGISYMYAPSSKAKKTLAYKATKKAEKSPTGRRINVKRVDSKQIHAERVAFNEAHFACKVFYHQNGKQTWVVPIVKKETPAITVKRILQILVPSNFYFVTDRTRKKTICKRDVRHRVVSSTVTDVNIVAHGENAAKEMLLKAGIDKDSIMTNKNVCYVTLHKEVSEERIKAIFPTLHMRVFKVKSK